MSVGVLTRDGYCTIEIKMKIAFAEYASQLNIELGKKMVRYNVWSIGVWLRDLDTNNFEM